MKNKNDEEKTTKTMFQMVLCELKQIRFILSSIDLSNNQLVSLIVKGIADTEKSLEGRTL